MSDSVRPDSIETDPAAAPDGAENGTEANAAREREPGSAPPAKAESGPEPKPGAVPAGPLVSDAADLPAGVSEADVSSLYELLRNHSMSESTRKAYAVQWRGFVRWADERGATALPADPVTVATYLKERADGGTSISTLASFSLGRCLIVAPVNSDASLPVLPRCSRL